MGCVSLSLSKFCTFGAYVASLFLTLSSLHAKQYEIIAWKEINKSILEKVPRKNSEMEISHSNEILPCEHRDRREKVKKGGITNFAENEVKQKERLGKLEKGVPCCSNLFEKYPGYQSLIKILKNKKKKRKKEKKRRLWFHPNITSF